MREYKRVRRTTADYYKTTAKLYADKGGLRWNLNVKSVEARITE